MFSERTPLEMTCISMSPMRGSEATERGESMGGRGDTPPRAEKKTVSDAYLGQRL